MTFKQALPQINDIMISRRNSCKAKLKDEDWEDIYQNIRIYFWKKWKLCPEVNVETWLNEVISRQMKSYVRNY